MKTGTHTQVPMTNFIIFSQILLIQRAKVLIIPHFFVYLGSLAKPCVEKLV